MSLPGNGIFVVRGEMASLMTAMRRGSRWNSTSFMEEEKDGLMKLFIDLKQTLNRIEDLKLVDPNIFLAPFLEVIRTDETTGVVTSLALAAINKFLSYGLIDPTHPTLAVTVENIVDAVTHARFMGTDQSSDGVTLFRVVEVLSTLMRSPEGNALTNESVCEVMLSCFKICFEPRLNELLRRSAEQALKEMVLLLFMRLPQFSEDSTDKGFVKKFQMMSASMEQDKKNRKAKAKQEQATWSKSSLTRKSEEKNLSGISVDSNDLHNSECLGVLTKTSLPLATTSSMAGDNILDMQGKITQTPLSGVEGDTATETVSSATAPTITIDDITNNDVGEEEKTPCNVTNEDKLTSTQTPLADSNEYINSVGVRFTQQNSIDGSETINLLLPYGLPCIQELFRFLILLCNPLDKQNTDTMTHMGLSLLTVAFEVGADNIGKYETLLELVKDDLCRNLILLMNSERLTIFAADLQLCFLLFESLRGHLKFQMEAYLKKLSEIISSDNPKTPYEMRELALDNLLQLWRVPGFVAELYINYDCDLYCTDVFEGLTKLLSKYTLSATNAVYSTHIIAMDALISVIEYIEKNCIAAKALGDRSGNKDPTISSNRHSRNNSGLEGIVIDSGDESRSIVENISKFINNTSRWRWANIGENYENGGFSENDLIQVKEKKRILSQGTELFNQRPDKGVQYLQENGILNENSDPMEIALFLRENPGLDKKMIGEYISKKKNVESKILMNFVDSFDFHGLRIDQALRLYLETFRLPGEAPLIFLVLEHFADHWHKHNNEPFANTDAAFSLAYAIIMLNMDQHNSNAKRLNIPMTQEDFAKNLRGVNGGSDFDQDMLAEIFNSIKNEEIVMPAEQTGIVRENYLWKVLLRRGYGPDSVFSHVHDSSYDKDLFQIIWGASLSALSFMCDKSSDHGYQETLSGFRKCAAISAHFNLHEDFDALIFTLCKFSTLLTVQTDNTSNFAYNEITQAVLFGQNAKAQAALKVVFGLVHDYGDCLRDSWKNILEIIIQLFRLKLLPKSLMEVEDFCETNGKALLILEKPSQKPESGLFSSLYSYLSSEGQRDPTYDEQEYMKIAKKCVKECQLDQMIQESKFIQYESLRELLKSLLSLIKSPTSDKTSATLPYFEDITVFWMEFLTKVIIQNRDRMIPMWAAVRDKMYQLIMDGAAYGYDYLLNRSIIALLKLAIYLMRNEELCPLVLQSLKMLLMLKSNVKLRISKQISIGIYELLKTSAQNIHSELDWQIIFTILECIGAGAIPSEFEDVLLPANCGKSDGTMSSEEDSGFPDRGYISDTEITAKANGQQQQQQTSTIIYNSTVGTPVPSPSAENWILVNKDNELSTLSRPQSPPSMANSLVYPCKLIEHSPFALFKCWDSLAFIVRNVAHITPYNFESCVRCIRTFVEACRDGGLRLRKKYESGRQSSQHLHKKKSLKKDQQRRSNSDQQNSNENEDEELSQRYETLSIQLLDLMYTLYTRTAQIFRWWAEEGCAVPQCSALWAQGWCPLLQGIARLATDRRREVRTYAISCLQQRALLVHDLQTLSGSEWASCFKQVLFPLLNELLPNSLSIVHIDMALLEESRIRTATIMSKVFLHHLTPLIELGDAFNNLWIDVLDYIEKFMKVGSDMLSEQMLEILKNMLLVMHSVRVFHNNDGTLHKDLWNLTWQRIGEFLPNLKEELFRDEGNRTQLMTQNNKVNQQTFHIMPQQQMQKMVPTTMSDNLVDSIECLPPSSPVLSPQQSIILQPAEEILKNHTFHIGQQSDESNRRQLYFNNTSPLLAQPVPQIICPIPVLAKPIEISHELQHQKQQETHVTTTTATPTTPIKTTVNVDNKQLPGAVSEKDKTNPPSEVPSFNNASSNNCEFSIDLPEEMPALTNLTEIERHQIFLDNASREEQQQDQQQQLQQSYDDSQKFQNIPEQQQYKSKISSELKYNVPTTTNLQSFSAAAPPPLFNVQSQSEIYSEYMQNPYNLIQQEQQPRESLETAEVLRCNAPTVVDGDIVKSTANYFSTNIDPSMIPAGSEMLYGQP